MAHPQKPKPPKAVLARRRGSNKGRHKRGAEPSSPPYPMAPGISPIPSTPLWESSPLVKMSPARRLPGLCPALRSQFMDKLRAGMRFKARRRSGNFPFSYQHRNRSGVRAKIRTATQAPSANLYPPFPLTTKAAGGAGGA